MLTKKLLALVLALVLICSCLSGIAEGSGSIITIDLSTATDEELAQALQLIKAEQQARLKTGIQLDPAEVTLFKGASQKVTAAVTDLPDGVKAGAFTWTSSDEAVATCKDGTIKCAGAGQAVITCTTTLTDGTEIYAEIRVTGLIPVKSLAFSGKKIEVMAGDVFSPEITFSPEDASDKTVTLTSSDEKIVKVNEDGTLTAGVNGKATVTATANDGSGKTAKIEIAVTKKIGKYDAELTFQGLEWGSGADTVAAKLKENGLLEADQNVYVHSTGHMYFWPDNDLLFANSNSWYQLPVAFEDQKKGAAYSQIEPQKKVGGYTPDYIRLEYLDSIDEKGAVNPEKRELAGVYIYFDNRHERGADIFVDLLSKMESQYGEFTRYLCKSLTRRAYKDMYEIIKASMEGAKLYSYRELGKEISLSYRAICTLRGKNNTGIMLMINTNENVCLFYGKTDALKKIQAVQKVLESVPDDKEDAGI